MFPVVLLLGAFTLLFIWLKWNYSFWKRNNVPGPKPKYFFGNTWEVITMKKHLGIVYSDWYKLSTEPYVGYYNMLRPAVLLRDPDLIKDIVTTNFNSFRNNDVSISKRFDPLMAKNPFFSVDDEWREGRRIISPMFSQSKLKGILPVMNIAAADFAKFIKSFPPNTEFDTREICNRFTTENVIKCLFSIEPDCFNKEQKSEFLKAAEELSEPSLSVGLKSMSVLFLPKWASELIPVPFVSSKIDRWLRNLVQENKNARQADIKSNDLFQTLLQIEEKTHNSDETFLAGHSFSLFVDGTETSSAVLPLTLYELARNPHCQEILHEEVVKIFTKYNGQLTYEALQEMTYTEGVLFEATRINPPALWLPKACNKHYTLPKTSKQSEPVTIYPGTTVIIPILAVHMDPKNYPDPEVFKPERFTDDNEKINRQKSTYLTFGEGPRMCLGIRFATSQLKIALAYIAFNFRIKISPNHKPIVIDPQILLSYPKDGILLQFQSR